MAPGRGRAVWRTAGARHPKARPAIQLARERRTPFMLPHGTTVVAEGGLPARWQDRRGTVVFQAAWDGARLAQATFRLPGGDELRLLPRATEHPVFGVCDALARPGAPPLACFAAVDWAAPTHIPPLDRPGALPAGGGTAVLNFLAAQAHHARRTPLRYAGPYPTGALFDALTESFRLAVDLPTAFARFTRDVEQAALRMERREVPVDFLPAPFERVWEDRGVCVQLRDGVEKIFVDGRAYARDAAGPRRVRRADDGYVATVEIAGAPWAEVLRLDAQGALRAGPYPLPPVANPFVGRPVSGTIRGILSQLLPLRAPGLLQPPLRRLLADVPLAWGAPGDDLAAFEDGTVVLHAVLPERLADRGTDEAIPFIVEAVEPLLHRLAQARVAELAAQAGLDPAATQPSLETGK